MIRNSRKLFLRKKHRCKTVILCLQDGDFSRLNEAEQKLLQYEQRFKAMGFVAIGYNTERDPIGTTEEEMQNLANPIPDQNSVVRFVRMGKTFAIRSGGDRTMTP